MLQPRRWRAPCPGRRSGGKFGLGNPQRFFRLGGKRGQAIGRSIGPQIAQDIEDPVVVHGNPEPAATIITVIIAKPETIAGFWPE